MAKRKRTSRRSSLVGRAVTAGRKALKEAESRIPPDLRKQVEQRVRDASKTVQAAIKEGQAQVKKASTRRDVNSFLKRLDGLTRQARELAKGTRRSTARRATTTKRKAGTAARRTATKAKTAARSTARKAAAKRPAATRRRAAPTTPAATETTAAHPVEPGMGETPSMG